MNITAQCCGLIILIIIMYFYLRCKKVFLNTETSFFYTLCSSTLCIASDIVSIIIIYHSNFLSASVVNAFCKIYLVSDILVAECVFMYIISDVFGRSGLARGAHYNSLIIFLIAVLSICLTPISFNCDEMGLYSYGVSVYIAAGFSLVYIITYVALLVNFKRNIQRKNAIFFLIGLLVFAAALQFIFKSVYTISFAIAVGMLVIYIKIENPESAIDRESGLFNQNTFRPFVGQRFSNRNPFSLIMITFDNLNKTPSRDSILKKKDIIEQLIDVKDTFAFKTNDDDLYILYENRTDADAMFSNLVDKFVKNSTDDMKPHIAYMPDSKVADDLEDMLHIFRYANKRKDMAENCQAIIDEEFLEDMKHVQRVEEMVNSAIENNKIEVFYQPIYSTEKHIFTSAEALVRIRDDKGQLIPPATFIEIAERNGTILKLGEMVFENVCKFLSESDILEYGLEYIEVNLSVVQCEHDGLAKEFIDIMRKYDIPGGAINLEITETATMASKKKLINNMIALRNYGCGFSLDDFGTGQSNLSYIVDMPVDIVKFDKDMTNAYFESNKAKYVMDAAMHMIHGMKLDIVSEGVETEEQLSIMSDLGIQYIQGYYFSKPISQNDYLEYIHNNNVKYYMEHHKVNQA